MSGDMAVKEASPGYELKAANQVIPVGYRKTDIGLIPNDWKHAPLSDLVEKGTRITYGVVQPGKNDPNGVLFIRGGDVYGGRILEDGLRRISETISKDYKRTCLSGGELLISLVGYPGEVALVPSRLAGANIARQVALVKLESSNELSAEYVCSYLRSNFGRNQLLKEAIGSAQQVINLKDVNKVEVILPASLDEQRAIATALSDVDALLEELDRLIAKKRDLKQASMQKLLTGQTRLPGFEGEWKEVSVREIITQSATYGIVTAGRFVSNGVKMVRGGDISDGRISIDLPMVSEEKSAEYQRTVLRENDIVIALVGHPGAAAVVPKELAGANISRAVGLLRLDDNVDARFITFFLNSPQGRKLVLAPSAGSAQQVVNLSALNKLRLTIPPINEQRAIAEILDCIDEESNNLNLRRSKAFNLKKAMMQELLTGRTRLI